MRMLIMDDRPFRKSNYMSKEAVSHLNRIAEGSSLVLKSELPKDSKVFCQVLNDYDLIAIHRSWLDENSIQLNDIIPEKTVIIFSGGISQTLYLNDGKWLSINAADFYTNDLPSFIQKYIEGEIENPLIEIRYGKSARLSILLDFQQLIWMRVREDSEDFQKSLSLLSLQNEEKGFEEWQEWVRKEIKRELQIYKQ